MGGGRYDVAIVGAGPAGIFTALELSNLKAGLRVLIVDSGRSIDSRKCPARDGRPCAGCRPCSIVSGWAGAGAYSDGKLSLSEDVGGNIVDYLGREQAHALVRYADSHYVRFGAPEAVYGLDDRKVDEIRYEASRHNIMLIPCPVRHMGTELALAVLKRMHAALASEPWFEFRELTEAVDVLAEGGRAAGLRLRDASGATSDVLADHVVLAPGRHGAKWLNKVAGALGIPVKNNEVDIGLRVEVPNAVMDHLTKHLYEAKLVYYSDTFESKVRTFCMNPGGVVSAERYDGGLMVVNGHSYADAGLRTPNTNFALLVSTRFTKPFSQPIEYGRYIASLGNMLTGGGVMVQRLGDLLAGRRTDGSRLAKSTTSPTLKSAVPGDLSFVLPHRHLTSVIESLRAFDKLAPGLHSKNTLLYGVEVKFYSSKIEVGGAFQTKLGGLYAIGDGAGVTRGLIQASATGVAVARAIHAGSGHLAD